MYKSGNTSLVKNLNKQHVLNLVRMKPGISAREISNKTKLQMSTVLYTLRSLQDDGFVREAGIGTSSLQGGKPPVMWDLANEFGYIIGVELLSREIRTVVSDFAGKIKEKRIDKLLFSKNVNDITEQVKISIQKIVQSSQLPHNKILGVGLGVPGSVNHEEGKVLFSYTFDFHDVDLKKILSEKIQFRVEVDNDANSGAQAIKWLTDIGHVHKHILYVSINQNFSGMGVGFILNNEIYRGAHGAAGEVTSFMTQSNWSRILKTAKDKFTECFICNGSSSKSKTNITDIIKQANEGERSCVFVLREVAKQISKKLVQLVDLFDPELIVVGGDMCEAEKFIKPIIEDRINAKVISEITKHTPIHFSPFGTYSGAAGATALIMQKYFHSY